MPQPLRRRIPLMGVVTAVGLAACQTIEVPVPEVKQVQSVEIGDAGELAPIGFDRVGVKIKRGTPIGTYEPGPIAFTECYGAGGNIFWNQGRVLAKNLEFADLFFEEMKGANFNVVGSPDKLFRRETEEKVDAAYLMGGQIEKIAMDACQGKDFWTGRPLFTAKGKGAVTVKWQVFSLLDRKVVFETTTEGAATVSQGAPDGELVIIQQAFANAVRNLTGNQELVELLSRGAPSIADIKNVDDTKLLIQRMRERKGSITDTIDATRLAVVTIESGGGHGSGFFIAPGLIMTNAHVVQNSQYVKLRLLTGRKILGEVIRKHPKRDVALIQVEPPGITPIPIRTDPARITETVFAIGSPLDKSLSGTVTKGIVSKFLPNRYGMEDIQADVDIQGGNSGGALLDAHGNIVGVTYAGWGPPGQFSAGVNFFVPIMDALRKLNVDFKATKAKS